MGQKNKYGQYMTPGIIADFMVNLIGHDKKCKCLEPSCGTGAFLEKLNEYDYKNTTSYEIDKSLINKKFKTKNKSFLSSDIKEKYDVIIGNPPYIRWKNIENNLKTELENLLIWNMYCNCLCDYSSAFILKSVQLLKQNGELIFITPDYWFSNTHAQKMRNYLLDNGYIKEIYHFNETPIFDKVKISFVIFKYVKNKNLKPNIQITKYFSKNKLSQNDLNEIKNKTSKNAQFFTISQFEKNNKWILFEPKKIIETKKYEKSCQNNYFKDFCEIGNGMVSGLDKAFKLSDNIILNKEEEQNIIDVIKAKDLKLFGFNKKTRYIFIKNKIDEHILKDRFNSFYEHLSKYKKDLLKRYNYGHDLKYWEWAFLRNYKLFNQNTQKIFCPCKERITNKERFRFSIIPPDYYPSQDVTSLLKKDNTKEDIRYITALLNSKYVFNWLSINGTRKGDIIEFSHRPVSSIPYRKIDFSNKKEKDLHNKIVSLADKYKKECNSKILDEIDKYIGELIEY